MNDERRRSLWKIEKESNVDHLKEFFDEKFQDLKKLPINSTAIFRVTVGLSESNPDAYKPMLVSIGPYHNKNSKLHSMEKYKLMYLQRFLRRKEEIDVLSCIKELEQLKDEALRYYEDIENLDSDILVNFSKMMLLDGCFVVEYIRESCEKFPKGEDMIIKRGCIRNQVRRDLLLMENQLPFFILTKLHDMSKKVEISFIKEVKSFFQDVLLKTTPASLLETEDNQKKEIKHLLHVVHMAYQPSTRKRNMSKDDEDISWIMVMPNVTELLEAGVRFKTIKNLGDSKNLFDINFDKKGVMSIPKFQVVDDTETLLRNIIAYEQQSLDVQLRYFTDFAIIMDHLIESDKDVSLLRSKGIIENWIGEDKEVASLFNKIGNGVSISSDFYYKEECIKAVKYRKKPWNKMKASLRHNYFKSPWVGASTVAAIVLLLLTVIQTILAVIDGVTKKN
ncbi:hypothetical protein HAX54_034884 [Datura stramonium]|uniref:Uncharacterized protein n=1 Tax=Datura stramonium TaxID=4076 RepID=A0ABS8SEP1_DATST|nr:hypothetical protein [Datura stramonium]